MKIRHTLCLLLAATAPSAFASNIVWISDQIMDANTPPGLSDQGFVNLLIAAGHNVTRGTAAPATRPTDAALNAADLVIIGRSAGSASFSAGANAGFWNGLTAPVLSTNPYALRNTQLGWNNGTTIVDQISSNLTFTNPGSAASAYIIGSTSMTGSTTTNSVTHALTYYNGAVDIRGTSISTDAPVAGATVIASTVIGAGPGTAGFITFWPAGTAVAGASNAGQVLGGFRSEFYAGNRESATAPVNNVPHAGYENLTPDGEALFLRTVNVTINRGAVPEPGSTALAFVAGAMALGRRRRRSA